MQFLGDYRIDDYITFGCQLHRFSSGAVYAPTGNVTYTFYENNSTSGAPTGGNLAQLDSKTGLYTARVQLTAAAGFEAGKEYLIHLQATVDAVAAAELLMFRTIANPKVDVDTVKGQAVTCAAPVTVLASVGTAATSTAQTGDSYARLGAPAGASIAADLVTIDNLVDDLETRLGVPSDLGGGATVAANLADIEAQTDDIGAAGAGLTVLATAAELAKVPKSDGTATWNATALASIQTEANDALVTYDPPTKAELDAGFAALNDPTAAAIASAVIASVIEAQGSYTVQQALSIILAVLAGVTSDNGATLKTPNGTTTRVSATIDASKNRTAMTLTPSA